MRVLLLTSHSIAEYDDLRMLTDLGYEVYSIGAYSNPEHPSDEKRPPLDVPFYADLAERCEEVRAEMGDPGPNIDWAKAHLHPDIIDWADAIIVHHFPERWIGGQWERIKHKRVIWRTCGQSSPDGSTERWMAQFKGLQIVRYSPNERCLPDYAGEDALIRFGKYPDDYGPWVGDVINVLNIAQHEEVPHARDWWLNWPFLEDATRGLPLTFAGPHTERIGGLGSLTYPVMLWWLAHARAYIYTGTQPASYTLGLIEAMMTGIPVVSIGPERMAFPELFEAAAWDGVWPDLKMPSTIVPADMVFNDPTQAHNALATLLDYPQKAETISRMQRGRAIELFGVETVGAQWKAFLE